MGQRSSLQTLLENLLGSDAVYFQPPESVKMKYPCIVYERSNFAPKYADNTLFDVKEQYSITSIDRDPDSSIPLKLMRGLQSCSFDRHFVSDGLNHDVFICYF